MEKYTLVLISIFISACSNFQHSDHEESAVGQPDKNQVCEKILRHKSVIKRCRPIISS